MKAYLPIDPTTTDGVAVVAVHAAAAMATIGIVDDNLDPPFMDALVEGLRDRYPGTVAVRTGFLDQGKAYTDWSDPNATVPITAQADDLLVVVGGGHDIFAAVCPSWGPFGGFAVSRPVL
jgi:hypothetical protein